MVIETFGKIVFEPINVTRKHEKQSSWKRVAMIITECDMHFYYAWFLKKRFNLELNRPLRGSHLTFISEKLEDRKIFDEAAKIFNGRKAKFFIDPEPRSNGEHWWLRAYSTDAEDIRESIGLPREPYFHFHLTIGHANEKNIYHSRYILEQCKKYELISNSPRKLLEEHEVMNFLNS